MRKLNLLRALNNACDEDDNYCVFTLKIKRENKLINYLDGYVISLKNIDMTNFGNDHKSMILQWVNTILREINGMYISSRNEYNGIFTITITADHNIARNVVHFFLFITGLRRLIVCIHIKRDSNVISIIES